MKGRAGHEGVAAAFADVRARFPEMPEVRLQIKEVEAAE